MCNHCDKQLCKTRKFGIGTQSMFPPLNDLQVVKTEPPIYRLNVDGERIELKAEDLQEQRLFIRACMNQIYTKPPKIKPKDFDEMINLLMMNKEEVEAPAGSSMIEQLKQHVENYCLGRATFRGCSSRAGDRGRREAAPRATDLPSSQCGAKST